MPMDGLISDKILFYKGENDCILMQEVEKKVYSPGIILVWERFSSEVKYGL